MTEIVKNEVGAVGASHLSKGDWKDLNLLHLSKVDATKATTTSAAEFRTC
jgi:hypothetical protein